MAWFSRSPLPEPLRAELEHEHPQVGRVHAVGQGSTVFVAACTECLALRRQEGETGWEFIGWHLVSQGDWDAETGTLRWTFADGGSGQVRLEEPGRVPEVFRDRVRASIVVEQAYPAPGGGQVVIAGRRQLGIDDAPVVWQVTTVGGASLADPAVAAFATARAAELRADYEL